tara:strand:+ start:168 stop:1100 length:933 start_codon:yes stop_codon:yes gene_type:complete
MIKKNQKPVLITLSDKKQLDNAKQLFSAAYHKAGWQGDFLLLAHNIPDSDLAPLKKRGIKIKKVSPITSKEFGRWGNIILNKLQIFDPYFKRWSSLIFLDSDILIRSSLKPITKVKTLEAMQGLVYPAIYHKIPPSLLRKISPYTNPRSPSINAGVLSVNTSILNKEISNKIKSVQQKLLPYFIKYKELSKKPIDEVIMSIVFEKNWEKLPRCYNIIVRRHLRYYKIPPNKINGPLLHFATFPIALKDKNNLFHEEWKHNLSLFKKTQFSTPPTPKKPLSKKEAIKISRFIIRREIILRLKNKFKRKNKF